MVPPSFRCYNILVFTCYNIPTESHVLSVISTNDSFKLGYDLWGGTKIHGKNQISHLLNLFDLLTSITFKNKENILHVKSGKKLVTQGIAWHWVRSCPKVFLLNGSHDGETSCLSASGFITAIEDALNRTYGDP
ncbi:hypothetical protein MKW98_011314 [Papaver atlanticum]|uniref:Uncharacterized protein n=1 Tax=Papaver atlanticum TaxID=357466 RepID=A0AAD4SVB3_9MAGN|nr:hypothetical protein MKW98_011314 [Papaver atlanticum]